MLASRQFSYWPGLPVWHNSGAHNTCNTPSTLPKNPFSRRSDAERVIAEAQYTEDYHIFQLSCYTQPPTREAVKTAAAGNNACRRETTPSPMRRVRSLRLVPFSMMETAKTITQTVRSSTSSVVDQHLDGIRECDYGSKIENNREPAWVCAGARMPALVGISGSVAAVWQKLAKKMPHGTAVVLPLGATGVWPNMGSFRPRD
ncbi:hypothetical protein CH63R_10221 [Colletotrichum higginsianum IMI 349063]|uniref:Uncharacterized protein n=1 Tax=Colletotrichum higginsianum (strain IMI 349063) TaxID=759273 RepID=A0A1B7Y252_COLHI|nr:uncharacterized protein CH63R_10221 [Colletotrichum higginsianum IMI 349063]OBR06101.1 hypothetical protein CH63R_10221 [Colletotrichum higginsianum IMI 349063]